MKRVPLLCSLVTNVIYTKSSIKDIGILWSNAKIQIILLDQVPSCRIVVLWVTTPIVKAKGILTLIIALNKECVTDD